MTDEYEWSAAQDEDGDTYYYNGTTGETSWDPPADGKFNPLPTEEETTEEAAEVVDDDDDSKNNVDNDGQDANDETKNNDDGTTVKAEEDVQTNNDTTTDNNDSQQNDDDDDDDVKEESIEKAGDWTAHTSGDGQVFYYNEVTEESTWERPAEFDIVAAEQRQLRQEENEENQRNDEPKPTSSTDVVVKSETDMPSRDDQPSSSKVKSEQVDDDDNEEQTSSPPPPSAEADDDDDDGTGDGEIRAGNWIAYKSGDGTDGEYYYYNTVTEETTWDRPSEFDTLPKQKDNQVDGGGDEDDDDDKEEKTSVEQQQKRDSDQDEVMSDAPPMSPAFPASPSPPYSPPPPASPDSMDVDGDGNDKVNDSRSPAVTTTHPRDGSKTTDDEEKEQEEEVDPATKKLEEAKAALESKDAIMENDVYQNVFTIVQSDNGNPKNAINALAKSAQGQTAVCGLMSRWLADLRSHSNNSGGTASSSAAAAAAASAATNDKSKRFEVAANGIREVTHDELSRLAKESYSTRLGDQILMKGKAQYLNDLMDSNRWRRLLIELAASNTTDALLMFVLKRISEKGHHREIAQRINQSEHFSVFHSMWENELSVLGMIGVSACHGKETSIGLNELVANLQRSSCGTAYTYLYAFETLRFLVDKAKKDMSEMKDGEKLLYARAIRKWERLTEVLQSRMIDPTIDGGEGRAVAPTQKRRLEVALTISELYQRKRRRIFPTDGDDTIPTHVKESPEDVELGKVESAVLDFLRRFSLGTPIDEVLLEKMLSFNKMGGDTSNIVGRILIRRPIAIEALLSYLYKPGSKRVENAMIRFRCSSLVAKAVLASETLALQEAKSIMPDIECEEIDEKDLTRSITDASVLCQSIENMVSFVVTIDAVDKKPEERSPGEKLCALAVKCSAVAQGVTIWARELAKGDEFVNSASYLSISPSIMSLVRIIYLKHPFVKDKVCDVAFEFLRHTADNIQSMDTIKQQSLRLLLFMCVRGEGPTVLDRLATFMKKTDNMDGSHIRYFVSGLLQVLSPPFSAPFARSFASMMMVPSCIKAVRTTYFDVESKKKLQSMLGYLKTKVTGKLDGRPTVKDDITLINTLVRVYHR